MQNKEDFYLLLFSIAGGLGLLFAFIVAIVFLKHSVSDKTVIVINQQPANESLYKAGW